MQRRVTVSARPGFPRWGLLGFALFAGCARDAECPEPSPGRERICVSRSGGQTGMEGSCLPMPEPQPVSAEALRALVEGTHPTTMVHRSAELTAPSNGVSAIPLTVSVELEGEPRLEGDCSPRLVQDVVVTLRFEEPALDVRIEERIHAFSPSFATLQRQFDGGLAAALGLPPGKVTFTLTFDGNGMRGTIEPVGEVCGRAVFPAEVRCPDWSTLEVELDRERDGFRPRDALLLIESLKDIPLKWNGGSTTTLSVALVESAGWACSRAWVETYCPEALELRVSIHAVAADGSIDAVLPALLEVDVGTEASASVDTCGVTTAGTVDSFALRTGNVAVPREALGDDVVPPGDGATAVRLRVFASADREYAEADVFIGEPQAAELGPPLARTVEPGGVTCFEAPSGARLDVPQEVPHEAP